MRAGTAPPQLRLEVTPALLALQVGRDPDCLRLSSFTAVATVSYR